MISVTTKLARRVIALWLAFGAVFFTAYRGGEAVSTALLNPLMVIVPRRYLDANFESVLMNLLWGMSRTILLTPNEIN